VSNITTDDLADIAAHEATEVSTIPACDIDPGHGPAYADAKLGTLSASWGFVCRADFDKYECKLGLGRGQRLIQRT
jgi:hypothetical protein